MAPSVIPAAISGRAPVRCRIRVCTVVAVRTIIAVIGRKARPVVERRVAEVLLQVVGEEQEDGEHRRAGKGDRGIRASAGAVAHDVQRQQRMRDARSRAMKPVNSTALTASAAMVIGFDHELVSALRTRRRARTGHQRRARCRAGRCGAWFGWRSLLQQAEARRSRSVWRSPG